MKDGYYLSVYAHIGSLSYLYQLEIRHDCNMTLWKKSGSEIILVHVWEFERLSSMKQHHLSFYSVDHAVKVINEMLSVYKLTIEDINEIWGMPGIGETDNYYSLKLCPPYTFHSMCHLYGSMMMDTQLFQKEKILAFAVDGAPDYVLDADYSSLYYYAGAYANRGKIEMFPVASPGEFWGVASSFYKLREGTLMALASACDCAFINPPDIGEAAVDYKSRAPLQQKITEFLTSTMSLSSSDISLVCTGFDTRFTEEENKISMAMKVIQAASFRIMEKNIEYAVEQFGLEPKDTNLAMGGGFGLNCPANSHLMQKYHFRKLLAPPYMNDCGISVGMGLYTFYDRLGAFSFTFAGAYCGNEDTGLFKSLKQYDDYIESVEEVNDNQAAEDISKDVVAWFNGRAEVGPRALGHRSLLADPRSEKAKDKLNQIKQRQWWRPVAPIVLEEEMYKWFEDIYPSPYMLSNFIIREDKKKIVPSILHLDGTSRVQSLSMSEDSVLYSVISAFNKKYGVPMICNTSLNDRGEPIIDTVDQMINFMLRKKISVGYVNGFRIKLHNHELFKEKEPSVRRKELFSILTEDDKQIMRKELNPFSISLDLIYFYICQKMNFDIKTEHGKRMLELIYNQNQYMNNEYEK